MIPFRLTAVLSAVLAIAACGAALAPGAGAVAIGTSQRGFEGGPALAADGRVVIGDRLGNGALRIIAIEPRTRAFAEVATFPRLSDARTFPELHVTGTGAIVTGTLDVFRQVGETDAEQPEPTPLSTRAFTILPAPAALGSCAPLQISFPQLDAVGGDGFVATVGHDCAASRTEVRIRTVSGATITIPAAPGVVSGPGFPTDVSSLRATGPMLSWVETSLQVGQAPRSQLVVVRGMTGEVLLRADGAQSHALGADGTVVFGEFPSCTMRVLSPGAPAPRRFALPATLCPTPVSLPRGQSATALVGGRIVYPTNGGYAVTDLAGNAHPLAEARTRGLIASPIAFDGSTVFVAQRDCTDEFLLAIDANRADDPIPSLASRPLSCPVRRASSSRLYVSSSGRVRITLRCPAGCRGTLRLVQQRRGGRERLVGQMAYLAPRASIVNPRVASYARRLAGCKGGLRVVAKYHPRGDDDHESVRSGLGTGLGAYRIFSGSRCRRTGGPPFTAPRPGPRP